MGYDCSLHAAILDAEKGHPWFESRAELVSALLRRRLANVPSPRILDLGCGTGLVASRIAASMPGALVVGADLSVDAASRTRSPAQVVRADLESPPFGGCFDAVLLLDVIEHFSDDLGVLEAAGALLAARGELLITVPAMRSLWSGYDVISGHERRYGLRDLRGSVRKAGLRTVFASYFMSFLPLPLSVRRRLASAAWKSAPAEALKAELRAGRGMSGLFMALTRVERALLLAGIPLPPGSSAMALAVREGAG